MTGSLNRLSVAVGTYTSVSLFTGNSTSNSLSDFNFVLVSTVRSVTALICEVNVRSTNSYGAVSMLIRILFAVCESSSALLTAFAGVIIGCLCSTGRLGCKISLCRYSLIEGVAMETIRAILVLLHHEVIFSSLNLTINSYIVSNISRNINRSTAGDVALIECILTIKGTAVNLYRNRLLCTVLRKYNRSTIFYSTTGCVAINALEITGSDDLTTVNSKRACAHLDTGGTLDGTAIDSKSAVLRPVNCLIIYALNSTAVDNYVAGTLTVTLNSRIFAGYLKVSGGVYSTVLYVNCSGIACNYVKTLTESKSTFLYCKCIGARSEGDSLAGTLNSNVHAALKEYHFVKLYVVCKNNDSSLAIYSIECIHEGCIIFVTDFCLNLRVTVTILALAVAIIIVTDSCNLTVFIAITTCTSMSGITCFATCRSGFLGCVCVSANGINAVVTLDSVETISKLVAVRRAIVSVICGVKVLVLTAVNNDSTKSIVLVYVEHVVETFVGALRLEVTAVNGNITASGRVNVRRTAGNVVTVLDNNGSTVGCGNNGNRNALAAGVNRFHSTVTGNGYLNIALYPKYVNNVCRADAVSVGKGLAIHVNSKLGSATCKSAKVNCLRKSNVVSELYAIACAENGLKILLVGNRNSLFFNRSENLVLAVLAVLSNLVEHAFNYCVVSRLGVVRKHGAIRHATVDTNLRSGTCCNTTGVFFLCRDSNLGTTGITTHNLGSAITIVFAGCMSLFARLGNCTTIRTCYSSQAVSVIVFNCMRSIYGVTAVTALLVLVSAINNRLIPST